MHECNNSRTATQAREIINKILMELNNSFETETEVTRKKEKQQQQQPNGNYEHRTVIYTYKIALYLRNIFLSK